MLLVARMAGLRLVASAAGQQLLVKRMELHSVVPPRGCLTPQTQLACCQTGLLLDCQDERRAHQTAAARRRGCPAPPMGCHVHHVHGQARHTVLPYLGCRQLLVLHGVAGAGCRAQGCWRPPMQPLHPTVAGRGVAVAPCAATPAAAAAWVPAVATMAAAARVAAEGAAAAPLAGRLEPELAAAAVAAGAAAGPAAREAAGVAGVAGVSAVVGAGPAVGAGSQAVPGLPAAAGAAAVAVVQVAALGPALPAAAAAVRPAAAVLAAAVAVEWAAALPQLLPPLLLALLQPLSCLPALLPSSA